jgi:cell division transport system ATP-binding protein
VWYLGGVIQFYHVQKRYPNGCDALTDVTLRVREGEFVFLTGPSGAGKSTLLRLLLVMERASDGQILIGGRNIHVLRDSSVPYLRRNIGVVFQDFRLIPRRTVFENIAISLEILGIKGNEIERRVNQMLEATRLLNRAQAYPGDLSGGEQQRVAIARALVNEPAILLADEPTGNLDPELSHEIIELLLSINRKGTTVVVATHDTALVEHYAMRTLALSKGQLIEDRPKSARADKFLAGERSGPHDRVATMRQTVPLPTDRQTGGMGNAPLVVPGAVPSANANSTGPIPSSGILPLVGSPFSSSPVRMSQPVPVLDDLPEDGEILPEGHDRGGEA